MNKFFSKHGLRILFTVLVVYGLFTSLILYKIIVKKEPVKDMVMTSTRQVVPGEQIKESRIELLDTDYESLLDMYEMPPLARMDTADATELVDNLMIMRRVHNLGYEESDFLTPEKSYKIIYTDVADYMDSRDYSIVNI